MSMRNEIGEETRVSMKLIMWGAGVMLAIMSPALALALRASIQIGGVASDMRSLYESAQRTEIHTGETARALHALDKRYEGDAARVDGRLLNLERRQTDIVERVRIIEVKSPK